MYNEQIEQLIKAALADGVLTEKEKQVLFKRAQEQGLDLDEFEMVLDARLVELKKSEKEKTTQAAPKSNKYGDVKKCPMCGAIVQAYQAKCTECGHEFANVEANSSALKLAEAVMAAKSDNDKYHCILHFPIPNTKADLLEFLTSLQPKMQDVNDPLSSAYFKKYQECINKAQLSFSNDPLLKPYIETLAAEEKALKKKRVGNSIWNWCKNHKKMSIAIVVVLIMLIYTGIESMMWSPTTSNDFNTCKNELIKSLDKNDVETAKRLVDDYHAGAKDEIYSILRTYMIKNGMYEDAAEYVYNEGEWDADENNFNYLVDCVNAMLANGQKAEAKRFAERKATVFYVNNESGDYTPVNVINKLNTIIENY